MNALRRSFNRWRSVLSWLPLAGVAGLAVGALTQDMEILRWREAYLALALMSVLGWRSARGLAAALVATSPTPIDLLKPGYVAVRGKARPLDSGPLLSPATGTACVWYRHTPRPLSGSTEYRSPPRESTLPFCIADATGQCLVSPAAADIEYGKGNAEHLILPGDDIYAIGQLLPTALTPRDFTDKEGKAPRVVIHADSREALDERIKAAPQYAVAPGEAVALPRLPMLTLPDDGRPFLIGRGDPESTAAFQRLMARLNLVVLLISLACLPLSRFASDQG